MRCQYGQIFTSLDAYKKHIEVIKHEDRLSVNFKLPGECGLGTPQRLTRNHSTTQSSSWQPSKGTSSATTASLAANIITDPTCFPPGYVSPSKFLHPSLPPPDPLSSQTAMQNNFLLPTGDDITFTESEVEQIPDEVLSSFAQYIAPLPLSIIRCRLKPCLEIFGTEEERDRHELKCKYMVYYSPSQGGGGGGSSSGSGSSSGGAGDGGGGSHSGTVSERRGAGIMKMDLKDLGETI